MLYRVVETHLDAFLNAAARRAEDARLPMFVEQEFRDFLTCGVLTHGFARLRCGECAFERLVPFSCTGRGFCPSYGGRRMTESAARLVEHVLPHVPIRQWGVEPALPSPLSPGLQSRVVPRRAPGLRACSARLPAPARAAVRCPRRPLRLRGGHPAIRRGLNLNVGRAGAAPASGRRPRSAHARDRVGGRRPPSPLRAAGPSREAGGPTGCCPPCPLARSCSVERRAATVAAAQVT
ncbi:MAG: transposase zinc-binding domain-containing protein [Candidatus Rokubacteria bacterium]|nr:transposase zinc-binding domain-containing protein [Candidatus Rokubacteria bacterium]MBI3825144.1 transposase zinc-binding domain-containing protein [Candidatus Rokubacteria bacterium]